MDDDNLAEGQQVLYSTREQVEVQGAVAAVHRDDRPYYYTIRLETGEYAQTVRERIRIRVVEHEDLADSTETPDTNSTQVVPQSGEAEVRFIVPFYQPQ